MISILITNYNKEKYLKKNIDLLFKSTYKNFEVILFDDVSTDDSLLSIKKFKRIKLIKNFKKKFKSPALNQIYGIQECFKKSKGEIICLLDSDDFFKKNKLKVVKTFFNQNQKINCIYNFPIASKKKFNFKNKKSKNIWATIFPTSCISLRRKAMIKFITLMKPTSFPNLEIDARINIFMRFYLDEYKFLKYKLTKYNDDEFGITASIAKYSRKWWLKRFEAYQYMQFILKKKNKKFNLTIDYIITLLFFKIIHRY